MFGLSIKLLISLLLLIGLGHAGLVHSRAAKDDLLSAPAPAIAPTLDKDSKNSPALSLLEQIPVTIIQEPEPEPKPQPQLQPQPLLNSNDAADATAVASALASASTELPNYEGTSTLRTHQTEEIAQPQSDVKEIFESQATTIFEGLNAAQQSEALATESAKPQEETGTTQLLQSSPQLQLSEEQLITKPEALDSNSIKALPSTEILADEQQNAAPSSPESAIILKDDLHRQATQATPTQTSTQQNFVQQLIQNSPIGQFLSQFTGQQQQQQQQQQSQQQPTSQQQADEPATPAPTLPGFLNPQAAITSAQQVVQNAAQSVVNTTTQAFQGFQQFATNLGTQFQNTFSTLAGQQNQLANSDATTARPPGPIQSLVNNFVNPGNNQATDAGAGVQQQQGQQQGPLQGILNFFQGGNRPTAVTAAPPKDQATPSAAVNDKIETAQNDAMPEVALENLEPDTVNEIRTSAEVTNEDASYEEAQGEEMIVVNDDVAQANQDIKA